MKIFIKESEKTGYLRERSFRMTSNVNARNTCSFMLLAPKEHIPVNGEEVKVYDLENNNIHSGLISSVKVNDMDCPELLQIVITVAGYNRYAERRVIANTFTNANQSDIVKYIVANRLAEYGVTEGEIQDGATIERISYNYMRCSAILDELASMNGRIWYIDNDKKLHFIARNTYLAPFNIDDDTKKYIEMDREQDDGSYRNTQIIRAGKGTTDLQSEDFIGDGTRKTFNVSFPIQSIESITVNGVEKSFGISKQEEEEKDFYYNVDKTEVTQNKDAVPLTSFYTLKVNYYGYYPIVVSVSDDEEIEARAIIEGASGIYESVEDEPTIDSLISALSRADGLMNENGKIQTVVSYKTYNPGLASGMLQRISIQDLDIDDDFLITSVTTSEHTPYGMLKHDITAVDGYDTGGWTSFFKRLTGVNSNYSIRGSEMFVILNRNKDTIYMEDSLLAEIVSHMHYVGTGIVGISDVYTEEEYEEIYA